MIPSSAVSNEEKTERQRPPSHRSTAAPAFQEIIEWLARNPYVLGPRTLRSIAFLVLNLLAFA